MRGLQCTSIGVCQGSNLTRHDKVATANKKKKREPYIYVHRRPATLCITVYKWDVIGCNCKAAWGGWYLHFVACVAGKKFNFIICYVLVLPVTFACYLKSCINHNHVQSVNWDILFRHFKHDCNSVLLQLEVKRIRNSCNVFGRKQEIGYINTSALLFATTEETES